MEHLTEAQQRAAYLKRTIEQACVCFTLNLAVYDNKIAFVDQDAGKIVALWTPDYTMPQKAEGKVLTFPMAKEGRHGETD